MIYMHVYIKLNKVLLTVRVSVHVHICIREHSRNAPWVKSYLLFCASMYNPFVLTLVQLCSANN